VIYFLIARAALPQNCARSIRVGVVRDSEEFLLVNRNLFRVHGFVRGDRLHLTPDEGVSPCPPF